MQKKPRRANEGIIDKHICFNMVYQGIIQSLLVVMVYIIGKNLYSSQVASTMGFLTLNLIQLMHMYNVRTNTSIFKSNPLKNGMIQVAFMAGLGLLGIVALTPAIANIFRLTQLTLSQLGITIGSALMIIPIVEMVKLIERKINKKRT